METNHQINYHKEKDVGRTGKLGVAEWERVIREHECSHTSIRQFCEDRGFRQSLFYYWRGKLAGKKRKSQSKKFVREKFIPVSFSSESLSGIKITLLGGIVIESSPLIDGDRLASLVQKLSREA